MRRTQPNHIACTRSTRGGKDECTLERYAALEDLQYLRLIFRGTGLCDSCWSIDRYRFISGTGLDQAKYVIMEWAKRLLWDLKAQGKIHHATLTRLS